MILYVLSFFDCVAEKVFRVRPAVDVNHHKERNPALKFANRGCWPLTRVRAIRESRPTRFQLFR